MMNERVLHSNNDNIKMIINDREDEVIGDVF